MNNEDDEVLLAWLIKRGYQVRGTGKGVFLSKRNQVEGASALSAEILDLWVVKQPSIFQSMWLYRSPLDGHQTLRSAVREWMFGL